MHLQASVEFDACFCLFGRNHALFLASILWGASFNPCCCVHAKVSTGFPSVLCPLNCQCSAKDSYHTSGGPHAGQFRMLNCSIE